ncbi:NAD(+) synthase [Defluviitalea phaphyphila]|uniref:NAD(+) synthase n=1 Tax=Defluviitalea phaphyphila TaxID=1473580 RepID=UPI000730A476|nr:NAD(+) synthase [Defluviitalea phaphyphila]
MSNGFIRIGAAVPKVTVCDCKKNVDEIIKLIKQAKENLVQILAFPELCITGYTCGDLFNNELLLNESIKELKRIIDYSANLNMLILVGIPLMVDDQLFNCGVFILNGKILGVIPKTAIPNHGEFYEKRWFASSTNAISKEIKLCDQIVPFGTDLLFKSTNNKNLCIGIEICEDLWTPIPPSSFQCLHGATLILNPSASNEAVGKSNYRKSLVKQQSARCMTGYLYVSCGYGESTTDLVFGGHAMIYENGSLLKERRPFEDNIPIIYSELDLDRLISDRRKSSSFKTLIGSDENYSKNFRTIYFELSFNKLSNLTRYINPYPFVPSNIQTKNERCSEIFSIQVNGLIKRLEHTKAKTVVLGISGGLDSTLALLVCVEAFDKLKMNRKNILGITMPGFGTTDRTYKNAINLMKNLGVTIKEISIKDACLQHFKDIDHNPEIHNSTYENGQARERTQILMDLANKENGLVIGTGDLSELALGWATYNGDHMSMYGVNTSIPKTLVRTLISWINDVKMPKNIKSILIDIMDTPVSPELLPPTKDGNINQKTEDIVGPYELHDFFLYYLIRFGFTPSKIIFLAQIAFKGIYDKQTILKWIKVFYKRFFSQQFKRSCLPDGPKVGSISLSPRGDWRMPSDASSRIWLDEIESIIKKENV